MARRSGLSLTEVLVALFLMAIGVIGVLTMFPVGAVQMGLALKDQRCAEAATQADAYMRWYWRHNVVEAKGGPEPMWTTLKGSSDPVFVDPMGSNASWTSPSTASNVAGMSKLHRVNLNQITTSTQALRTCTLLDGFTYDGSGLPQLTGGTQLDRENRYNWLWILQRPPGAPKYTANMTIVVFDKRPNIYTPPNAEVAISSSTFNDGQSLVTLGSSQPQIQKGSWLMDASTVGGIQQATFYRVSGVNGTSVELNSLVQTAVGTGTHSSGNGTALYLTGVAEVFERPQLTADDPNAP